MISCPCSPQGGTSRAGGEEPASSTRLFHVHGTNEYNTKAIEVPVRASSLNSNDVFVLKTPSCCYLWYGKVGTTRQRGGCCHPRRNVPISSSLAGAGDEAAVLAWQGCSGDEREMGKMVADTISKTEKPVVAEGQEPPEFWLALGGKSQYANSKRY